MPLPHEIPAAFTTDDLVVATSSVRGEGDRFLLRVPEGWRQGRGAFGGLVLGALARAIETCEADPERVLRSISGQLIGPVLAGEAVIEVRLLRSAPEAIASGWVRSKKLLPRLGAPELIAYADAWWPAMLATEQAPRPTATVAFTMQLFTPSNPLDPSRPLHHRAHAVAGQEGYAVELRELWSEQGELVALNQQTFVTIK
jgi:hypothetical protein